MGATRLRISGRFHWSFSNRLGRTFASGFVPNGVTYEGVNECLNRMFLGLGQTNWWMGVIDQSGFVAVSTADTHASHAGWTEFTGYGGGARPLWSPAAASGGVMATSAGSSFTITGGGSLRGVFLASRTAWGTGVGSILYCTAITTAAGAVTVIPTDVLTVTYVVRITGS